VDFVRPSFEACARTLIRKCRAAGLGCFLETSFGIGIAVTSIGFGDFIVYSLEHPEVIARFFDYCERGFTPVYELFHALDPDFILIGDDIAFGQGPYLRPQEFRSLVMPHFARMAQRISLPWVFHSDGNLMPIMDDLLKLGMNAIHPIEPYGTMDIVEVKRRYGHRVALAGNLDMNLIANGTPGDIREAIEWLFTHVGGDGGWILGSSNSIDSGASPANVCAMGDAVRSLRYA
jgi:uroporphyrinogen decarboxylase